MPLSEVSLGFVAGAVCFLHIPVPQLVPAALRKWMRQEIKKIPREIRTPAMMRDSYTMINFGSRIASLVYVTPWTPQPSLAVSVLVSQTPQAVFWSHLPPHYVLTVEYISETW